MSPIQVRRSSEFIQVVDDNGVPIGDCTRFLERIMVRGLSVHTAESYAYDLALILRWLSDSRRALEKLTSDDLHDFIAWERGRGSHPRSINRRLHTLRLFHRFVVGLEMSGALEGCGTYRSRQRDWELGLQRLPKRTVRQARVKVAKKLITPLTPEQVQAFVQSLHRYRDIAIAYLMLLCGLRSAEVLHLRLTDVETDDRRIRVPGKGNKERSLPLPPLVIRLVDRYLKLERPRDCITDRLFVVLQGRRRGQPMGRTALRRVFRTRRENPALANANPHRLRHTFGTDMARAGVRLPILQRMMGHAHPETTLEYVYLTGVDVAAEFQRAVAVLEARYSVEEDDSL